GFARENRDAARRDPALRARKDALASGTRARSFVGGCNRSSTAFRRAAPECAAATGSRTTSTRSALHQRLSASRMIRSPSGIIGELDREHPQSLSEDLLASPPAPLVTRNRPLEVGHVPARDPELGRTRGILRDAAALQPERIERARRDRHPL